MHILLFFHQICFKVNLSFLRIDHSWFQRVLVPTPPRASTLEPNFLIKSKKRANKIPVSKFADSAMAALPKAIHSLHSCHSSLFLTEHPLSKAFSSPSGTVFSAFSSVTDVVQFTYMDNCYISYISLHFITMSLHKSTLIFMCQHHSALVEHHHITSCAY